MRRRRFACLTLSIAFLGPSGRLAAERAVKTVLDEQGKPDLPHDRLVDATVVREVLRERR